MVNHYSSVSFPDLSKNLNMADGTLHKNTKDFLSNEELNLSSIQQWAANVFIY